MFTEIVATIFRVIIEIVCFLFVMMIWSSVGQELTGWVATVYLWGSIALFAFLIYRKVKRKKMGY